MAKSIIRNQQTANIINKEKNIHLVQIAKNYLIGISQLPQSSLQVVEMFILLQNIPDGLTET